MKLEISYKNKRNWYVMKNIHCDHNNVPTKAAWCKKTHRKAKHPSISCSTSIQNFWEGLKALNDNKYHTRQFIGESNIWQICFIRSNWQILYWRFELPCLSSWVSSWLYGCVHIVINIGGFNIGEFCEKLPILLLANKSPCTVITLYTHYTITTSTCTCAYILPILPVPSHV